MGRRWKIGIGVLAALVVLLIVNAVVVSGKTGSAEVTEPGGRLLDLPEGEVQVVERGPRDGAPIVLIHCFTCAIDWWDGMLPALERDHRVLAVDLLGHGGSEKPGSDYSIERQAELVAGAMRRTGIGEATVVGHSLGGTVAVGLTEVAPDLVDRVAIVDMPSDTGEGDLGFLANLTFMPVIGEALWTVKPDSSVRQGLEVAFAPGFEVPDAFVEDANRMTYTAYDEAVPVGQEDFIEEAPLDERLRDSGKPLLVLMGAEEQTVSDPEQALRRYADTVPGAQTRLIQGAGHSPNVEKPAETAALILAFANEGAAKAAEAANSPRPAAEKGGK
ncbi:MAG TPA: alpha/beta fold hydrolase [Solirubrobacterales bacterium]|nr:alpha/beta fold hydrolase [Solirubrobacterales bacterium]